MRPFWIGALAILVTTTAALAGATDDVSATPARKELLLEAQAALAAGHADRAIKLYEQVEAGGESVAAEVGLVRARLQTGDMRAAIAFANLVAGEHPDAGDAIGVLAYIEDRLGYTEQALKRLAVARGESPADVALLAMTVEILLDRGASGRAHAMLEEWVAAHGQNAQVRRLQARLTRVGDGTVDPMLADAWPPAFYSEATGLRAGDAIRVANGFIVDGGATVITHASAVAKPGGNVVVRNGLGLVRTARTRGSRTLAPGLVALTLTAPFPKSASVERGDIGNASQSRFCFALCFPVISGVRFSYPVVAPGMIFRASIGDEQLLQVTSPLAPDQIGSPLFDDQGRLIGMAIGNQAASAAAGYAMANLGAGNFGLRIDALRTKASGVAASAPPRPAPKPAIEELYERLAPTVVQIFVER